MIWTRRTLLACAAALAARPAFAHDPAALVDPYTEETEARGPRRTLPFTATFQNNGRRLTFVATLHDTDRRGPTFRAIDRAFAQRPNALLVEGFPSSWGVNPARILDVVRASAADPRGADSYVRGEPGHALRQALQRSAPIHGGEPDNAAIDRALIAQGYAPADIAAVKVLQWIPQGRIAGEFRDNRDPRFRAFLDQACARIAAEFEPALLFNRGLYERWHARQFGRSVYEDDLYHERLDPRARTQAGDISRAMTLVRDRHIFGEILRVLARHDRTLVVYGGVHLITQWRALNAALSVPRLS